MVLIGESGFTAQTNSATVSTLSLMIFRSAPCWIAATVPARSISPNDRCPVIRLRTVVPPPADDRMPLTSAPSALKKPFSMAMA